MRQARSVLKFYCQRFLASFLSVCLALGSSPAYALRSHQIGDAKEEKAKSPHLVGLEETLQSAGAEEKKTVDTQRTRQLLVEIERLFSGEDPLSEFITTDQVKLFLPARQAIYEIKNEVRSFSYAFSVRRYQELQEVFQVLQDRLKRYRKGERSIETLPRLSRRIVHLDATGSMAGLYPSIRLEELSSFAQRHWDLDSGRILDSSRRRFVTRLSRLPLRDILSGRKTSPSLPELNRAFSDLEEAIRANRLIPTRRQAQPPPEPKKLSRYQQKEEARERSQMLAQQWIQASKDIVERIKALAPSRSDQRIGPGTTIAILDDAGGTERESLAFRSPLTLGLLENRLRSGQVAITLLPPNPRDPKALILLKLSRIKAVKNIPVVQRRIQELERFPDPKLAANLFPKGASPTPSPPKSGLEEEVLRSLPSAGAEEEIKGVFPDPWGAPGVGG